MGHNSRGGTVFMWANARKKNKLRYGITRHRRICWYSYLVEKVPWTGWGYARDNPEHFGNARAYRGSIHTHIHKFIAYCWTSSGLAVLGGQDLHARRNWELVQNCWGLADWVPLQKSALSGFQSLLNCSDIQLRENTAPPPPPKK